MTTMPKDQQTRSIFTLKQAVKLFSPVYAPQDKNNTSEYLKELYEKELAAHFRTINHSKAPNTVLNCAAVATYVVSQFMPENRRLKKAKTHLHLYPSWNRRYFNSIQKQKESLCEGYSHKKTADFDYDLLQQFVALLKIKPFTPLIIGTEMLTINHFGHDVNAFVLPYDPMSQKAKLVVFDAHGLVPKPWCRQRNFDKCYRINEIDVFDCQEARDRVQEWMEKSNAYQNWRTVQSDTVLNYFEPEDFESKIEWNAPAQGNENGVKSI